MQLLSLTLLSLALAISTSASHSHCDAGKKRIKLAANKNYTAPAGSNPPPAGSKPPPAGSKPAGSKPLPAGSNPPPAYTTPYGLYAPYTTPYAPVPTPVTPVSTPATPVTIPDPVNQTVSDGSVAAEVVAQHNAARAKYGASPLTWSAALYPDTQTYANKCVFQHSGGDYSENLFVESLSAGDDPIKDAVNDWMSEAPLFDYNNPQFTEDNGHFVNIVFKSATQVACAVANCAAGTIYPDTESQNVVCRYTGNDGKGFGANVGKPAAN